MNIIVNGFNNYFVNIGKYIAQQINNTTNPLCYINTNINSFIFQIYQKMKS